MDPFVVSCPDFLPSVPFIGLEGNDANFTVLTIFTGNSTLLSDEVVCFII